MSTHPIPSAERAGPESRQAQAVATAISTDLTVVREAEAGMRRALDRFLVELQDITKAYVDSERGRLFAMRNSIGAPEPTEVNRT